VDVQSHAQHALTHNHKGVSFPRWSPSDDQLAYLANDVNNKPQIFIMPMNGGDAEQLVGANDRTGVGLATAAGRKANADESR